MKPDFCASCIQLNSTENPQKNLANIKRLINQACDQGANFIFLPEHAPYTLNKDLSSIKTFLIKWQTYVIDFFCQLSLEKKIWLSLTMAFLDQINNEIKNRTYLINDLGAIIATYDKIHLFNAKLTDKEDHSESKIYTPGTQVVTATTPWGTMGLAICYDLRFPQLFQMLRRQGADFFCIPSSFSYFTGRVHWHALACARAIENGCYLFAPDQWGEQNNGFIAYGHSLIVSPWGEILEDAKEKVGVISAHIKQTEIQKARTLIPASEEQLLTLV